MFSRRPELHQKWAEDERRRKQEKRAAKKMKCKVKNKVTGAVKTMDCDVDPETGQITTIFDDAIEIVQILGEVGGAIFG